LAVAVLAGCGGGTGGQDAASYCDQYWKRFAARLAECERGSTVLSALTYDPGERCADPVAAVRAGRAAYSPTRGARCLDFLARADCPTIGAFTDRLLLQEDCAAALVGKGVDGPCATGASCESGRCVTDPLIITCDGSCVPLAREGDPCNTGATCVAGTYCSTTGTGTCVRVAALGAACGLGEVCGPGLYCDQPGTWSATCQPRTVSGPCSTPQACAVGHFCHSGGCQPRSGPGEGCTPQQGWCGPGLWCGDTGACLDGAFPPQSCGGQASGEWKPCLVGVCSTGTSTCTVGGAVGGGCSAVAPCPPPYVCTAMHLGFGTCAAPCAEP
jgi:hypothetical protein